MNQEVSPKTKKIIITVFVTIFLIPILLIIFWKPITEPFKRKERRSNTLKKHAKIRLNPYYEVKCGEYLTNDQIDSIILSGKNVKAYASKDQTSNLSSSVKSVNIITGSTPQRTPRKRGDLYHGQAILLYKPYNNKARFQGFSCIPFKEMATLENEKPTGEGIIPVTNFVQTPIGLCDSIK